MWQSDLTYDLFSLKPFETNWIFYINNELWEAFSLNKKISSRVFPLKKICQTQLTIDPRWIMQSHFICSDGKWFFKNLFMIRTIVEKEGNSKRFGIRKNCKAKNLELNFGWKHKEIAIRRTLVGCRLTVLFTHRIEQAE